MHNQEITLTGYFIPPTVITNLKDSSRCMQEEIFGPVVCVAKFSGDDEGKDNICSVTTML